MLFIRVCPWFKWGYATAARRVPQTHMPACNAWAQPTAAWRKAGPTAVDRQHVAAVYHAQQSSEPLGLMFSYVQQACCTRTPPCCTCTAGLCRAGDSRGRHCVCLAGQDDPGVARRAVRAGAWVPLRCRAGLVCVAGQPMCTWLMACIQICLPLRCCDPAQLSVPLHVLMTVAAWAQ